MNGLPAWSEFDGSGGVRRNSEEVGVPTSSGYASLLGCVRWP